MWSAHLVIGLKQAGIWPLTNVFRKQVGMARCCWCEHLSYDVKVFKTELARGRKVVPFAEFVPVVQHHYSFSPVFSAQRNASGFGAQGAELLG